MSIKKIAEMVGVSASTVSRVLNNPDYKCSDPGIRDKIWNAAIELNYTPNIEARNLKLGISEGRIKRYTISILMTRTESRQVDPFYNDLLRVIESEIYDNQCVLSHIWYMPVFSDERRCKRTDVNELVDKAIAEAEGKSDGLIIIGKCCSDALKAWKQRYNCIASVSRNSTNYEVDEVLCDGWKVASMAVKYLIGLGHTAIGYAGSSHFEARYLGFVDTMRSNNIDIESSYVQETALSEEAAGETMRMYMGMQDPPTAIYCANDIIAIGMLKTLRQYRGISYRPAIIGSDDIEQAGYTDPMLTTIHLPCSEMGRFTVDLLLSRIKGKHKSIAKVELEGKLVERESCRQNIT